mmetsp:Transcript_3617/g.10381  ORF Transcript_3617/g.10381 Transcript_3617/m.10381 type:complete len:287 (-) Transcript_3617:56-916(-)
MPFARGALGCAWLADDRLYCVGGANSQLGPFANDLMIYAADADAWSAGPAMAFPRDHIEFHALEGGQRAIAIGGRSHYVEEGTSMHPVFWKNSNEMEMFDVRTQTWKTIAPMPLARGAVRGALYHRNGPEAPPNLLLGGGQRFIVMSGQALNVLEEFDVEKGVYYCHAHLPHPYYGGGFGVHDGKLHIVGGAEWLFLSATRRVMVVDLAKAPRPEPCMYTAARTTDQWERTGHGNPPYPDIDAENTFSKRLRKLTTTYYDHVSGVQQAPTQYEQRLRQSGRMGAHG